MNHSCAPPKQHQNSARFFLGIILSSMLSSLSCPTFYFPVHMKRTSSPVKLPEYITKAQNSRANILILKNLFVCLFLCLLFYFPATVSPPFSPPNSFPSLLCSHSPIHFLSISVQKKAGLPMRNHKAWNGISSCSKTEHFPCIQTGQCGLV